MIMVTGN